MLPALTLLATLLPLALAQYDYGNDPSTSTTSSAASPSSSSSSGAHIVQVGNGGTKFTPNSLTASAGDTVEFQFFPANHSVVQSSFQEPCVPSSNALFSGFVPVKSGVGSQSWTLKINNTNPIWLYCAQAKHCQAGMAIVINPP
jgi:plastocyanin